ncbi:Mnd2p [Saccharomyces cerevisiae x Saccharomyces kudriavzevii VIN7]|uniref:Mnd2p n=1 Tax=Saccharomyces cerevisiae x Saccharomyces kudriavzevii (strain VIN7) TaxID=1095631 RepID=H0GWH2_SACCK|nr:Mnd2p [Saccharomyces cerevisiae x Saccharomyces kudriavzevii VIN7]
MVRALRDIALFNDIRRDQDPAGAKHEKYSMRDLRSKKNQHGNCMNDDDDNSLERFIRRKKSRVIKYIPSLSAYNVFSEFPYFPTSSSQLQDGKLDEFMMLSEQYKSKLPKIRKLGWNRFKPIGINKTMYDSEMLKSRVQVQNAERKSEEDFREPSFREEDLGHNGSVERMVLPHVLQENDDDIGEGVADSHSVVNDDIVVFSNNSANHSHNEGASEEDEISYDYDAEFDHVVDEEDNEEEESQGEEIEAEREKIVPDDLLIRPTSLSRSLQQFVEEVHHIDRNPYDIDSDNDGEDSKIELGMNPDFDDDGETRREARGYDYGQSSTSYGEITPDLASNWRNWTRERITSLDELMERRARQHRGED